MEVTILKVTNDVYALDSTKGNYAYLILGEEIVIIDTGRPGQGKGILNDLKSMNIEPQDIKHILITHHDVDHVGSAAFLQQATGAKIWVSKEDIPYICGEKNREGLKRFISFIVKIKKPETMNSYPKDQKIEDIEIIPTPGHTPGHVCLLYNGILFIGDLFRTSNGKISPMKSFMNWNDSILRESMTKIDNYDFKWICSAHGEPIKRNRQLEELY